MSEEAELVRAHVYVPDVFDQLGLELPARIPGHVCCPWHEDDTPSLWIRDDRWWCFGCGVGGDVIDLVRHITHCSYPRAIEFLQSGINLNDYKTEAAEHVEPEVTDFTSQYTSELMLWADAPDAQAFVHEKWPHLSLDDFDYWGVRPGGRGAYIMIPHYDENLRVCGIKTRTVSGGNVGRKLAFKGSTYPQLYKVEMKDVTSPLLMLVEGESDTWTCTKWMRGIKETQVAGLPSGVQGWRKYLPEIESYERVYVSFDNDEAGNTAAQALLEELGARGVRMTPPEPHKDWTEWLVKAGE